jgi:DNA-binding FadR family transcriptional regulator
MKNDVGGLAPNDKNERLYIYVSQQIKQYLLANNFQEGDRLPSETELSREFEVSRATVREAIVALEVGGVLAVKRNVGAIVQKLSKEVPLQTIVSEAGPFEQIQVRMLLEPEAAYLAAQRRSAKECELIEDAIKMMVNENKAGFASQDGDMQFHLLIAKAANHSLLCSHIESLWEMRHNGQLWHQLQRSVDVSTMRTRAVFEHMKILEAIRSQNADNAKLLMAEHLRSVQEELEGTINA